MNKGEGTKCPMKEGIQRAMMYLPLRVVGFPVAITAYLLLRFEKKINKLADTIAELERVI